MASNTQDRQTRRITPDEKKAFRIQIKDRNADAATPVIVSSTVKDSAGATVADKTTGSGSVSTTEVVTPLIHSLVDGSDYEFQILYTIGDVQWETTIMLPCRARDLTASSGALVDVVEVADALELDDSEHEVLGWILGAVEAGMVEAAGGRPFATTAVEWHMDGNEETRLYLPWPLASAPSTVHFDSTRAFAASTLLTSGTDYIWRATRPQTLQKLIGIWSGSVQTIKVTGTVGWAQASVPKDLKMAAIEECGRMFSSIQRAQKADDIVASQRVSDWETTYLERVAIHPSTESVARRYAPVDA